MNPDTSASEVPVVASYCATFLKPEMLHIYRQITSLRRVRPIVIAQKRENADRFPFENLFLVKKPGRHFLRRIWHRQIRDQPWQISRAEVEQLQHLLTAAEAKLLHIYFGHIAVHLFPLLRAWAQPCLVSFHGADVGVDIHKPAYRTATKEMLAAVQRVLVRSESLKRAIIDLGCAPEKIEIQRTGIPLDQFQFRERTAPSDGQWQLLQAGRLIAKKGVAITLRAFAKFRQVFPTARLTIAGEGPLLRPLRQLTRELRIESVVRFAGFVAQADLRELFYSSHLFLHPSETAPDGNQEGVPNSMLEAMASGLPIFATRHGGIPEAVEDGVNGILVDERDHESLADALIVGAGNPARLFALARAGALSVAKNFDQAEQTRRLEEIYLKAIASF